MPQNRLQQETSPYLLQHADNPVDWWPWCEEALTLARQQNRPILLSIGYSACHWCHVMAHESFEDPATAEVMNRLYINIKVDREERPDLDKIYQSAHHLLNRRAGGWPLTAMLTPDDLIPFFVGTYFPKTPRHNMPAFVDVLQQVVNFYHEHHDEILKQNDSLTHALQQGITASTGSTSLNPAPLDQARRELGKNYDKDYAGFGAAPKFPHPTSLERLLRHWSATQHQETPDTTAQNMAMHTLRGMAMGGIYDQIGGGFCRYSVDEMWMIPHFEKMLYDNGPLLALYADAWSINKEPIFKQITQETAEWVIREMQSPEGGYYSTLDADSEGEEGRFYVWTPDEVKSVLTDKEYPVFAASYGLDRDANFEGQWHLHRYKSAEQVSEKLKLDIDLTSDLLLTAKQKLFNVRKQRIHPGRDEKILTSWNALMIKGMAIAGRRLQRADFITSAEQALDFIHDTLYQDGRLLACYKDGQARLSAYLDDYAFLIDAILELLQSHWQTKNLFLAISLADSLLEHFEDKEQGGFYFTADDHEQLYHRPKPYSDESIPAGNGIAAYALQRLGYLLGEQRYIDAAERTLKSAWPHISHIPYAHCALLLALEENLYPPTTVIIRGSQNEIIDWQSICQASYQPRLQTYAIPDTITDLPGLLTERKPEAHPLAYLCTGTTCQPPVHDLKSLATLFNDKSHQLEPST
ncbi:MAG: thioredoxin domain-containing protein [Gammaproteobacteria bacterium]|nr:thioredoxin domain-containing protein [Gammaproteobacteria bacterium]